MSNPKNANQKSSLTSQEQRHLTPFLDCIAYLMAKRWLHDQRQAEASPQDTPEHHDKP
jgi:hypothetical protein